LAAVILATLAEQKITSTFSAKCLPAFLSIYTPRHYTTSRVRRHQGVARACVCLSCVVCVVCVVCRVSCVSCVSCVVCRVCRVCRVSCVVCRVISGSHLLGFVEVDGPLVQDGVEALPAAPESAALDPHPALPLVHVVPPVVPLPARATAPARLLLDSHHRRVASFVRCMSRPPIAH
jgi:hypothetical protein